MTATNVIYAAEAAVAAVYAYKVARTLVPGLYSRSAAAQRQHARNTEIARDRNLALRDKRRAARAANTPPREDRSASHHTTTETEAA